MSRKMIQERIQLGRETYNEPAPTTHYMVSGKRGGVE